MSATIIKLSQRDRRRVVNAPFDGGRVVYCVEADGTISEVWGWFALQAEARAMADIVFGLRGMAEVA